MRMRGNGLFAALTFAGLGAFGAFAVWAFHAAGRLGGGWSDLVPIWPYVLGGVLMVGVLTAALMWLAFYSDRHGYDDPPDRP